MFRVYDSSNSGNKGQPIILQHGILDSSDTWVVNENHLAPAYILAKKGYDVWLGNTRGNKHSRNHMKLDPDFSQDEADFFDISFEEMGDHDYPAMIDYVLAKTGRKKLAFIAHS